jgi:hypothetical protein
MGFARRGWDRRTLLGLGGALLATRWALPEQPAAAGRGWCRSDPVLLIDGVLADLFSSVPLDSVLKVTGPTQIVITTPKEIVISLAIPGLGFLRGEKVSLERSRKLEKTADGIELKIELLVPARDDFPVRVDFAPRVLGILKPESTEGQTNRWIKMSTKL